jgi:hypothetical protein
MAIETARGNIQAAADAPLRPLDATRCVEDSIVGPLKPDVQEKENLLGEAGDVVDRVAIQFIEAAKPERLKETGELRASAGPLVRLPGDFGHSLSLRIAVHVDEQRSVSMRSSLSLSSDVLMNNS